MNQKIYKQYDSRWGAKPYPTKASLFSGNGCGCVSNTHLIMEKDPYKNTTPEPIRQYMVGQGFAVAHQGTTWSGIPKTLNHYGLPTREHDSMTELFTALNARKKKGLPLLGVILFRGGSRGGVTWTSSGHYVAFTDYKIEGGKHWFYMKDSGPRDHDGWYCYEKHMYGLCYKVWSSEIDKQTPMPTPKPSGKLTVDGVGGTATVKALQKFLGTFQDGIISGQLENTKKYYPAFKSVMYGNGGSACIKKLQKWLGLSDPDGYMGPNTMKALQKKLRDFGYLASNEKIDGYFGPKSMKALQEFLNNDGKSKSGNSTPSKTSDKSTDYLVVDVSYCQSSINWTRVKNAGIKGAIVRCGFRGYETGKLQQDSMFLNHLKGAKAAGLKVGVYFFTEGINAKEGKEEADYTIKLIKNAGIKLDYPIAIDTEYIRKKAGEKEPRANNLSKAKRTEVIKAFCEQIKAKGYEPMIYASTAWLNNNLDMSKLPYKVGCAQYYSKCEYKGKYVMWQYSSSGKVDGIKSDVDMNHCYI